MKKILIVCVLAFAVVFLQSCSSSAKQCAAYAKHQTDKPVGPEVAG